VESTLPPKVEAVRAREEKPMDLVKSDRFRLGELRQKMVE
jgi:hypothetical protein